MARREGGLARLRGWVPLWWRGEGGAAGRVLDAALWPLEQGYRGVTGLRNRAYDRGWLAVAEPPIPVISVGNLSVGGAGKTPVSAWVARLLARRGHRPALVLRGYGEDEILVHRELNPDVPVFPAKVRAEAVLRAHAAGCGVAVVDDGFQHRALARDLDLVLVAAEHFTAERRLLPRGPWREGEQALRRAHLALVTRKTATLSRAREVAAELGRVIGRERVAVCHLSPTGLAPLAGGAGEPLALSALAGRPVLAVASLADPEPFARQLRDAGAAVELLAFPDHHRFSPADAERIAAAAAGRAVAMTRKEAVKLRPLLPPGVEAYVLQQEVVVEEGEDVLVEALTRTVEEGNR